MQKHKKILHYNKKLKILKKIKIIYKIMIAYKNKQKMKKMIIKYNNKINKKN